MSSRKRTVSLETLGCRLNQFESDGILQHFLGSGAYESVPMEHGPDIAIINTCTVTDQADTRNHKAVEWARRQNAASFIVVTGCFAQTDRERAWQIPGVDLVVGNDQKSQLFQIIESALEGGDTTQGRPHVALSPGAGRTTGTPPPSLTAAAHPDPTTPSRLAEAGYGQRPRIADPFGYGNVIPVGHTRGYLKIQDGCDRACSYCKIPTARGRGVSRPSDDVLEHALHLDDAGVPEIVLTGVNLGWYRDKSNSMVFALLIERILQNLKHARLRLSSIEPCDVDEPLAEVTLHPRFCDFLHVPLQSGSSKILRAMRRTYSAESFQKRVETVLRVNPDIFLGTDVIVGFPGETEEDFALTAALCTHLPIANIHCFRYSPRAGTPASSMPGRPDQCVVRKRMEVLRSIHRRGLERYVAREEGRVRHMIVEKLVPASASGLTDNFLRVDAPLPSHRTNVRKGDVVPVTIGPLGPEGRVTAFPIP